MPRPTRAELERHRGARVDDLIGPGLRLLFVGINPGLWTAAVNAHFARPGNRFWPALHRAGITPGRVDASEGLDPADADELVRRGVGISNLVNIATARAESSPRAAGRGRRPPPSAGGGDAAQGGRHARADRLPGRLPGAVGADRAPGRALRGGRSGCCPTRVA